MDFKRVIVIVKDFKGIIFLVVILYYFFKSGEEEDIVFVLYGNVRGFCKRLYVRIVLFILFRIKKECFYKKLKRFYGKKFSSNGGLLESDSVLLELRNFK